MIESKQSEIEITNISYPVFSSIMQYLYTGDFHFGADLEGQEHSLEYLFEFLRVSDEYILEDVSSRTVVLNIVCRLKCNARNT
jgi:hypothetical protein